MAKRVLEEILTGIDAKKQKKRAIDYHKEEISNDSESPSMPVKSKCRSQPYKTPKERVTGKGARRSLIVDDKKS